MAKTIKLTPLQKQVLSFFGQNEFGKNFYWTGGTLLAYQYLHHRFSVDLDFFSPDLFADDDYLFFVNDLKKSIKAKRVKLTAQHNRRLYQIYTTTEVLKLELVFFPFPAIEKRKILPEFSLAADSLTDIMVNKTLSAYQRQEPKDAYDLYYYLSRRPKHNLASLIKLVEKKFGLTIEPVILLAKINELANSLDKLTPLLTKPAKSLKTKVKKFFQTEFNNLVKKQIK